jgi:type IV secretion system protein VirB2
MNPSPITRFVNPRVLRAAQAVVIVWTFILPSTASAQGMPWEGPIMQIVQSLTGPVAKGLGIIAIVCTGLGIAFSEGGTMMRKALWVVLGLALTFSATTWALPFLGFMG